MATKFEIFGAVLVMARIFYPKELEFLDHILNLGRLVLAGGSTGAIRSNSCRMVCVC